MAQGLSAPWFSPRYRKENKIQNCTATQMSCTTGWTKCLPPHLTVGSHNYPCFMPYIMNLAEGAGLFHLDTDIVLSLGQSSTWCNKRGME